MDELAGTIYRELHAIARNRMAAQPVGHTLQPTALVNEAWLKLRHHFDSGDQSPAFYRTAAEAMRQILIDHARARHRLKRGGDGVKVGADDALAFHAIADDAELDQILSLHDALTRLEKLDAQAAEVVKLRFFGGRSVEETAAALNISERTVKRDWQFARVWLAKELSSLP